jgi:hypothetical protein
MQWSSGYNPYDPAAQAGYIGGFTPYAMHQYPQQQQQQPHPMPMHPHPQHPQQQHPHPHHLQHHAAVPFGGHAPGAAFQARGVAAAPQPAPLPLVPPYGVPGGAPAHGVIAGAVGAAAAGAAAGAANGLGLLPALEEESDVAHAPAHHGYGLLIGEHFRYVLRSKQLQLGRHMAAGSEPTPNTLGVSSAKNISRVHASIHYDPEFNNSAAAAAAAASAATSGSTPAAAAAASGGGTGGSWVVTCLGKNGMQFNGVFMPAQGRFPLRHKDRLQVGESVIYFLEPNPMSTNLVKQH